MRDLYASSSPFFIKRTMIASEKKLLTSSDTKCIKPLYLLATFMGVAPPYNFKQRNGYFQLGYRVYTCVLVLLFSTLFLREVYFQVRVTYYVVNTSAFLLEIILNMIKTFVCIISILHAGFWKRNDWYAFLNALVEAKYFCQNRKFWKTITLFEIISAVLITILYLIYDGYLWVKYFGHFYQYYAVSRIQYLYIMISVLFVCIYALLVKYHANHLIKRLQVDCCDIYKQSIRQASDEFEKLSSLVELFNSIFACRIFLILGIALVGFLEAVNFFLMYSLDAENSSCMENDFSFEVLVLSCLQGILLLYWILFLIIRCDHANKELEKISKMCYQLLRILPDDQEDMKLLLYLAQESTARCPQLTAGNVFPVKIGVFFALISSLTSYIIVLVQFSTSVPYKCPEHVNASKYHLEDI